MTKPTCKISGCTNPSRARGMCTSHYAKWRRAQKTEQCAVPECQKIAANLGLCPMHYQRRRVHGDVETVKLVHNDPDRRFREFYDVDKNGCWIWNGWIENNGYARFSVGQERWGAHRWAYERYVGPIPQGLALDHLCRVRACVNPDHLEPVTWAENLRRSDKTHAAKNRSKTHCKRGHSLSGKNLSIQNDGSRRCLACHNIRQKQLDAKKKLSK